MRNDVSELLDRHAVRVPAEALERILQWYIPIDDLLNRCPEDDELLVDFVMAEGLRGTLFKLEGLYRIYARKYGKPVKRLLGRIKRLEDILGQVDHHTAMYDAAVRHECPTPLLEVLREYLMVSRAAARDELRKRGWVRGDVPARAVKSDLGRLAAIGWEDWSEDRLTIIDALARELRRVDRKVYDFDDLEAGIHELRRDLRWLPIVLVALGNVAELHEASAPIPEYEVLLDGPYASSPFAQLPTNSMVESPILISRVLYIANTKAIAELGEIKDEGQILEAVTAAAFATGEYDTRKEARGFVTDLLEVSGSALEDLLDDGRAIYDEIDDLGLVKRLRKEILRDR